MNETYEVIFVTAVLIGIIYYNIVGLKWVYKNITKKLNTKLIRKKVVTVIIKDKQYSPGYMPTFPNVGVNIKSSSYRIEVIYNEKMYILHNRQIFESKNIGDKLEMNLVEIVDKKGNLTDSYLEVIQVSM